MTATIHVLDEATANKIAAGEVVDRPASVIKELVENAIDAKADKIEVEILSGGASFMRVTDNGCGMSKEDAALSVLRHATSKLKAVGDLHTIHTLGFRGEALPTIASVSKFSLLTRQEGSELAHLVEMKGGKIEDIREAGGGVGTTVKVEDLFYNTPARKKFLKTPASEGSHINDILIKLAISNPGIAFKFINNNKLVISTPGGGKLFDTLKSIYGAKIGDELLALDFADEDVSIGGFLSKPTLIRSSRGWQTFIVNGRVIASRMMAKALDNAYHSLLPKSGYPLAALRVETPKTNVDVNVHPQKTEIKFADEGRLFKAVYKAVADAIKAPKQLDQVAAPVERLERRFTPIEFHLPTQPHETVYTAAPEISPGVREASATFAEARQILAAEAAPMPLPAADCGAAQAPPISSEETLAPLGQVELCYIVARGRKGLFIVDQHAAHERILYDRFAAMADEIPSQQLLVHLFLDFDEKEYELVAEHRALFAELGFAMEPSGPRSMRLKEVPADIPIGETEPIIREILSSLSNLHQPTAGEIRHACLAITACRAAIKAGDELNIRQMQILLDELLRAALPYTCPHGRPSIIKFTGDDLAKMFKRT